MIAAARAPAGAWHAGQPNDEKALGSLSLRLVSPRLRQPVLSAGAAGALPVTRRQPLPLQAARLIRNLGSELYDTLGESGCYFTPWLYNTLEVLILCYILVLYNML